MKGESPMDPRVSDLTLEEKARLVSGASFWNTESIEARAILGATLTDGPHGVRLQKETADHLGLYDSEPATAFPTASATGSTWNPELIEEMGRALGAECRFLGVDVLLGPGVNIKRSPLCGRNFEYFSEDPLLAGVLGAAWVNGLQSQGVGASVKHFAANNQETDRMRISAEVDERTLRETYLPAFERIVRESKPATLMCSYNKINGTLASQNRWLLTDLLRDEWGFDGYVVSDWGAVQDPVAAITAGLDLEMPSTGGASAARIVAAVRSGELEEPVLDTAVNRLLTVHERLRSQRTTSVEVDFNKHNELAYRLAIEGTVLLSNEGKLLPVSPDEGGLVAVIGEFARDPRFQGGGSSRTVPARLDNAWDALQERISRPIGFAPGFTFSDGDGDLSLHDEAVDLARRADVAVLFLGLPADAESEGFDRTDLRLPRTQLELASKIFDVNPNVAVVLSNGGVVTLEGVSGSASAILESWLGGQASGTAIADILIGTVEPGGRLAETIPHALEHTPAYLNWPGDNGVVRYGERIYVGYRWYDTTHREVAFPFGHGLSYTSFALSDLEVEVPDTTRARATCRVVVENTGNRPGAEVVQVYVASRESKVDRPNQELRAFAKVRLQPGERQIIELGLDERAFAYWGPSGWTVDPGEYEVAAGTSSRNLPLRESIVLDVPTARTILAADSTMSEWLEHAEGRQVVGAMFAQLGAGAAMSAEDDAIKLFGGIPLRTMIGFAATESVDVDSVVQAMLAQLRALTSAGGPDTQAADDV